MAYRITLQQMARQWVAKQMVSVRARSAKNLLVPVSLPISMPVNLPVKQTMEQQLGDRGEGEP